MRPITKLVLHQTGTASGTLESITNYHVNVKGWKTIGYHHLITADGNVHKGRPQAEVGAHCEGDNVDSLGVCCVGAGNAFPLDKGYMSTEMFYVLVRLLQQLREAYPTITAIYGHNERPSGKRQGKTCPGYDAGLLRAILL